MFEYREGSVIHGSQFRGWGRGDWGQGWSGAGKAEETVTIEITMATATVGIMVVTMKVSSLF